MILVLISFDRVLPNLSPEYCWLRSGSPRTEAGSCRTQPGRGPDAPRLKRVPELPERVLELSPKTLLKSNNRNP